MNAAQRETYLRLVRCLWQVNFDQRYAALQAIPSNPDDEPPADVKTVIQERWGASDTVVFSNPFTAQVNRETPWGPFRLGLILSPTKPTYVVSGPSTLDMVLGTDPGHSTTSFHYLARDVKRLRAGTPTDDTFVPAYDHEVATSYDIVGILTKPHRGEAALTEMLQVSIALYHEVYVLLISETI